MRRRLIPVSDPSRRRTSRVAGRRARGDPEPTTTTPGGDSTGRYVELLTNVAGSATLIGALLYYFGWARAAATFRYFGIEIGVLDLSFQDYLLRSVRSTYFPLLTVVVIWLAALFVHRALKGSRVATAAAAVLIVAGVAGVVVGVLANFGRIVFPTAWPVIPALLLVGAVACSYGAVLLPKGRDGTDGPRSVPPFARALIGGVLLLLLFWFVSSYANYRGTNNALAIDRDLESRPGVVVLSAADLHLRGDGVTAETLEGEDSAYRFCYSGLRYLVRSGGRQFLLPEHWQRGRDPVTVIRETDSVLFEFYSSVSPPPCPR